MKGAIDIIRGWREICKKHSFVTEDMEGFERIGTRCMECELYNVCFCKKPADRTDEDILDLVNKIGGVTR